ncbi:MAG: peptide deformylase [Chloroflexi bacterium]|nr:peptide deformylase [Chloroflexota bacterium]
MAVREIYTSEHPVLRQKAKKVKHVDASIHKLIDDMLESMRAARGLGLAAPQIGVSLRVLVIELPEDDETDEAVEAMPRAKRQVKYSGDQVVLINPEVLKMEGEQSGEEGCLSIPGYVGVVRRAEKIAIKGLNRKGKEIRINADGLLARALQHEVDHLEGILYTDRIEKPGDLFRLTEDNERVPVFQGGAKHSAPKQVTPFA